MPKVLERYMEILRRKYKDETTVHIICASRINNLPLPKKRVKKAEAI